MANELPGPVGDALGDRLEELFIQRSCDLNAERPVGRYESLSMDSPAKLSSKAAQNADLSEACPQIGPRQELAGAEWKSRAEWIPHRPHATIMCRSQQRPQDLRKNMSVFVRVYVRNRNSSRLNPLNLRPGLGLNFASIHSSCKGTRSERLESVVESSRISNGWKPGGVKYRLAIDQHDVAADAQAR